MTHVSPRAAAECRKPEETSSSFTFHCIFLATSDENYNHEVGIVFKYLAERLVSNSFISL